MSLLNFKKRAVGIDIADRTIELVELEKKEGKISILNKNRVLLNYGIVERGRIKNGKILADTINEMFAKAKPNAIQKNNVFFGLPESQVYTHNFILNFSSKDEIDNLVLIEIKKNIPIEEDDLLFSYKIIKETEKDSEVLVVATSRTVFSEWQDFFRSIGVNIEAFDVESLALFRSLSVGSSQEAICLIDIGAITTNISIYDQHGLRHSYSIGVAGNDFTKEISDVMKISIDEAEKLKREIGISESGERVSLILVRQLDSIIQDIEKTIKYFKDKTGESIKKVILVGGSSGLNNIKEYFETNLEIPAEIGFSPILNEDKSLEFIEAVGLALRGVGEDQFSKDPAFYVEENKKRYEFWKKDEEGKELSSEKEIKDSDINEEIIDELKSQKRLLGIIILAGIFFVTASIFYRNYEKTKIENETKSKIEEALRIIEEKIDVIEAGKKSDTDDRILPE